MLERTLVSRDAIGREPQRFAADATRQPGAPSGYWRLALGLPLALALSRPLTLMRFSDAVASGLGVMLRRRRVQVLALSVVLTALAVAVAGPVGMVGLIGPEIARSLCSSRGLPLAASALAGALVMVLADLVGRLLLAPIELPVGIVTAVIGGPWLLWILLRPDSRSSR